MTDPEARHALYEHGVRGPLSDEIIGAHDRWLHDPTSARLDAVHTLHRQTHEEHPGYWTHKVEEYDG